MCKPEAVQSPSTIDISATRLLNWAVIIFLSSGGMLSACGPRTETTTTTVPIDTTVVDDDTLEVNDTARFKQTERAR